ncbi:hypothetical protein [Candidatus Nanohalovita haloferacivicina]|uniref:hypothetical protein n=1 Tax=Candidatus Nanohalovita haloferacivicina TaxID=2978046 RepID=UPI00325FC3E7|nr:hypothetical protein HBNXNv_0137 [Candidatus Nanohalobia archaeon BNXNv]
MNLKKALKHDVQVAGKTIPTMILVGLFLVGGGSAALLTNFGTVSRTADVDQAVTFDGPETFEFSAVGGQSDYQTSTVTNHLNSSAPVRVISSVKNTPSTDKETTSGTSLETSSILLKNGKTYSVVNDDAGESSASFVMVDGTPAVRATASYEKEPDQAGEVSAGLFFNASGTLMNSSTQTPTTFTVDYQGSGQNVQKPDWIYAVVSTSDQDYMILDPTVEADSGAQVSWSGDGFTNGDAVVYEVSEVDSAQTKGDFQFGTRYGPSDGTDPVGPLNLHGAEIRYVGVGTGTNYDQSSHEIYYTGFQFNGEQLIKSGSDFNADLPSGESQIGTVADANLAAVPGDYTVGLNVTTQ